MSYKSKISLRVNALGGSVFNFSSVPGFNAGTSGGCTVASFNNKIALIGDIQQDPNLIGIYELRDDTNPGPAQPVTGNMTLSHTEVVSIPAPMAFLHNRATMVQYNVYRSTDNETYEMIGSVPYVEGQTYYEYVDAPGAGTYYYQVRALYDNDCESEPAPAFDDPTHNYVTASVDAVNENSDNVALYPNPTKGNVTIEATGMSRITVVSVLGQVVYDTEVSEDTYVMNMSQFTAGMYMVRVYTESGVTVKRVTVMQ